MEATLTLSDQTVKCLKKLINKKPNLIVRNNRVKEVILDSSLYNSLISLLEDIEDLRDAKFSEKEYFSGEGKPFDEYDRKRKARIQNRFSK